MNYKLYSIKDVLSGNFTDILIFNNEEMAVRYFNGLCAESKIKDDLQLFCLGSITLKLEILFLPLSL